MIAHEKFKKNAIILYKAGTEERSAFEIKYNKMNVSLKCKDESVPCILESGQFDLRHAESDYSIKHVGKTIFELQQDFAQEVAARIEGDVSNGDSIIVVSNALQEEQKRAIEEEVRLDGALKSEQTRAKAVEDNIIETVSQNKADADQQQQQIQTNLSEEATQRRNADKDIKDEMDVFKEENAEEHDELRQKIQNERERAQAKEQQIKADVDSLTQSTNDAIKAVEDELETLISATNADTLNRMDDLLDRLEAADDDIGKAITDALTMAEDNQRKYRKIVFDLTERIAYLEGVVIETFNQDRRYDNYAALIVAADILGTGDGSQSGYYKQYRKGCIIDELGFFKDSSRNVFIRADQKYSLIFDSRINEWKFVYCNPILNIDKAADTFQSESIGAGTNPEAPVSNEAMGVYIEQRGAISNTNEDGALPGDVSDPEEE